MKKAQAARARSRFPKTGAVAALAFPAPCTAVRAGGSGPVAVPKESFMKRFFGFLPVFLLFSAWACGGGHPYRITNPMDLEDAAGAPSIRRVVDLGHADAPTAGDVKLTGSDGKAVAGELLFIEGRNFGRGPSVSVGGQPAVAAARTGNGGILVKVPAGVPEGRQNVVVSTHKGVASFALDFLRFGAAAVPGKKAISILQAPEYREVASIETPAEIAALAFSASRPLLYAVTQVPDACRTDASKPECTPELLTVELTLPGYPITQRQKLVSGTVLRFSMARYQDRALVATSGGMQVINLEYRNPIIHQRMPWKGKAASILEAVISPDGKSAVALLRDNQAVVYDVSLADVPKEGPAVNLLPEEKAPLVKTLAFFSTRAVQTLYIATGDTPESLVVGWHPASLLKAELQSASDRTENPVLTVQSALPLPQEKITPELLFVSPLGATEAEDTQRTEWTHFLYIAMVHGELMPLSTRPLTTPSGLQMGVELLDQLKTIGFLSRVDFRQNFKPFFSEPAVIGAMATTHTGKDLLSVRCVPHTANQDAVFECGLHRANLQTGKGEFTPSGTLPKERFRPPFRFGAVAVQE